MTARYDALMLDWLPRTQVHKPEIRGQWLASTACSGSGVVNLVIAHLVSSIGNGYTALIDVVDCNM
jgi:hypothetical protein